MLTIQETPFSLDLVSKNHLLKFFFRLAYSLILLFVVIEPIVLFILSLSRVGGGVFGILMTSLFWYVGWAFIFGLSYHHLRSWSPISWNQRKRSFYAERVEPLLTLGRGYQFSYDQVSSIKLQTGPESKKPLHFHLVLRTKTERNLALTFRIDSINLQSEALDFTFRIANAMEWKGYFIDRNDPRSLIVELYPESKPERKIQLVPAPMQKDALESKSVGFQEPKTKLPEVNPQEVSTILVREPKLEWWPKTSIRIHQPKAEPSEWLSAGFRWALFCGLIGGGILLLFFMLVFPEFLTPLDDVKLFPGTLDISGKEIYMVSVILGCFILGAWLYYKKNPDREISFDKTAHSIVLRKGSKEIQYDFNQVEELILEGHRVKVKSGPRRGYHSLYWCVFVLKTNNGKEKIISSKRFRSDLDVPYRTMLPMIVEIARLLQVSWAWKEYRSRFSSYLNFLLTPSYRAIWPWITTPYDES